MLLVANLEGTRISHWKDKSAFQVSGPLYFIRRDS